MHFWNEMDKPVRSMEAPPHLQDLTDQLLMSWCHIMQHTFRRPSGVHDLMSQVRFCSKRPTNTILDRCHYVMLFSRSYIYYRVRYQGYCRTCSISLCGLETDLLCSHTLKCHLDMSSWTKLTCQAGHLCKLGLTAYSFTISSKERSLKWNLFKKTTLKTL